MNALNPWAIAADSIREAHGFEAFMDYKPTNSEKVGPTRIIAAMGVLRKNRRAHVRSGSIVAHSFLDSPMFYFRSYHASANAFGSCGLNQNRWAVLILARTSLSRNNAVARRGACLPAGRSLAGALIRLCIRAWTSRAPTPTDRLERFHSYCRSE